MDKVLNTVELFIKKYNLQEEKIIAAFSGGIDSMCLLDICRKLNLNITAVHLNHNWRGSESFNEQKICEDFCKSREIEFFTETLPDNIKRNETTARTARYEFFEHAAAKFKSKAVLTAHNADDNAETVLYRIIKGTGVYGLDGIPEQRGIFYRPLLTVYRKEIERYCEDNALIPCIDSSNDDIKYKRNLIRKKIFPLMETINKDVKQAINSLSEIAAAENKVIEELLPTVSQIKTHEFCVTSYAVQKRIVHRLLKSYDIEYSNEKINNITEFIKENSSCKSGKIMSLTKGLNLFVSAKEIRIIETGINNEFSVIITGCGTYETPHGKFSVKRCTKIPDKYPKDNEGVAYVDLSKIDFPLELRTRKDGDIIYPLGISGSKKLKKYLNDKKIPNHEKSKMLFLCNGKEIFWVPSTGLSDKIKVTDKPTHILKLLK